MLGIKCAESCSEDMIQKFRVYQIGCWHLFWRWWISWRCFWFDPFALWYAMAGNQYKQRGLVDTIFVSLACDWFDWFTYPLQKDDPSQNVLEEVLSSLTKEAVFCGLPSSSPAMDVILSLTAQKIRELFTICGIENSEEHLNLVIAHAADHGMSAPTHAWENGSLTFA